MSSDYSSIYPDSTVPNVCSVTATLRDSSGNVVPNVDVYFTDNDVRFATGETDSSGSVSCTFNSSVGGNHVIKAYTRKQGAYDATSAFVLVYVYRSTSLSLTLLVRVLLVLMMLFLVLN